MYLKCGYTSTYACFYRHVDLSTCVETTVETHSFYNLLGLALQNNFYIPTRPHTHTAASPRRCRRRRRPCRPGCAAHHVCRARARRDRAAETAQTRRTQHIGRAAAALVRSRGCGCCGGGGCLLRYSVLRRATSKSSQILSLSVVFHLHAIQKPSGRV